jgi:hypothetical protein
MKKNGRPLFEVDSVLRARLERKVDNEKKRVVNANMATRYLTNNEENCIVCQEKILAACGRGICTEELLELINIYIHQQKDARLIHPATMKTVRGFLNRHKGLVKIIQTSSIDPKRAEQACEDTRDGMFFKAECYFKMPHAMGLVHWETMADVLPDDMLNMDEVATDTTKHRRKLEADASANMMQLFQITPECDGKMNMHLTACITSCANGRYQDKQNNIEGAVDPLLAHTDKSQTKEKQKEERERQRMGKAPSERRVADRFKRGTRQPRYRCVYHNERQHDARDDGSVE